MILKFSTFPTYLIKLLFLHLLCCHNFIVAANLGDHPNPIQMLIKRSRSKSVPLAVAIRPKTQIDFTTNSDTAYKTGTADSFSTTLPPMAAVDHHQAATPRQTIIPNPIAYDLEAQKFALYFKGIISCDDLQAMVALKGCKSFKVEMQFQPELYNFKKLRHAGTSEPNLIVYVAPITEVGENYKVIGNHFSFPNVLSDDQKTRKWFDLPNLVLAPFDSTRNISFKNPINYFGGLALLLGSPGQPNLTNSLLPNAFLAKNFKGNYQDGERLADCQFKIMPFFKLFAHNATSEIFIEQHIIITLDYELPFFHIHYETVATYIQRCVKAGQYNFAFKSIKNSPALQNWQINRVDLNSLLEGKQFNLNAQTDDPAILERHLGENLTKTVICTINERNKAQAEVLANSQVAANAVVLNTLGKPIAAPVDNLSDHGSHHTSAFKKFKAVDVKKAIMPSAFNPAVNP